MVRNVVCWVLLFCFPMSLSAANTNAAMLYAKGTTWVNGGPVPDSTAVFPGDLIETKPDSMANINASGSNVMIRPDTVMTFDGNAVSIDRGTVSVKTDKALGMNIEKLSVLPTSNAWTEFEVANLDGKVSIMALKGDVTVTDDSGTSTLSQGQQTTRELSATKKRRRNGGAIGAAGGGILDNPIIVGVGAAAIGGLVIWVALQSPYPASPAIP